MKSKKEDFGYCVWHPEHGFDGGTLVWNPDDAPFLFLDVNEDLEFTGDTPELQWVDAINKGWRVVPCKMTLELVEATPATTEKGE